MKNYQSQVNQKVGFIQPHSNLSAESTDALVGLGTAVTVALITKPKNEQKQQIYNNFNIIRSLNYGQI